MPDAVAGVDGLVDCAAAPEMPSPHMATAIGSKKKRCQRKRAYLGKVQQSDRSMISPSFQWFIFFGFPVKAKLYWAGISFLTPRAASFCPPCLFVSM